MNLPISIIVPTLNEAESLAETLAALQSFKNSAEIIVVDGGSRDETVSIAESFGVRVLKSEPGRGAQMSAGANVARGETLWFLHADTISAPDSIEQIVGALKNPAIVGGNFTIRFAGGNQSARFLTWLYPRLGKINLRYGDSAIFARREVYERIGGLRDFPIFEDLDLMRRLRAAGKIVTLPAEVVTSARRFENKNFALVFARWTILQILYWLGVSPHRLAKAYSPHK